LGVYTVREGAELEAGQHFAINLFDSRESDLVPREVIDIPYFDEKTEQVGLHASLAEPSRKEIWKLLLIIGLLVLVFEWYVYNRRVYL
jgi:predicted component of type VI protein secretion system